MDNDDSNSTLSSLMGEAIRHTEVIRYVFAFLSVVSLHAIFFSLQVGYSVSNMIDAVFVANVAFRFSMLLVVLLFVVKFGPVIVEILLSKVIQAPIRLWMLIRSYKIIFGKKYDYFLEPEHLKNELVLIEKIDELIDSAEPVQHYLYQFVLVVTTTWMIYLNLLSIIYAVLLSVAISVICQFSVLSRFNKVSFVRAPDYHSVWYGRKTVGKIPFAHLYSKDKNLWSMIFGMYTFLSVFSVSTGVYRYSYLLSLPPLQVRMSNNEVIIGNYIGSTADGVLIRRCSDDQVSLIAYNGLVLIDNTESSESHDVYCN